MKKNIIGAIVGGIIIFIWQFLSWGLLNLHEPAQKYTPQQDSIISYLGTHLKEGGYLVPTIPPNASSKEMEDLMRSSEGKPWAAISYHSAWHNTMFFNMAQGLVTNFVIAWLFCIIVSGFAIKRFGNVFVAALFTGLIVFLNSEYTMNTWYPSFALKAHFMDAMISWGLTGIWLGWWLKRK